MTDYNNFLTRVAYVMARYFESQVGICDVHPGMLTDAEQDRLKDNSPLIYTTISEILETEKVDTGNVKNSIQVVSFVLVYNLSPPDRDRLVRELVFKMIALLVGQRWGMEYVYPAADVKAFDLHGLLRKPDEILGTQGWSPTLQARASDLFGDLPVESDPQFSIWCVTWEQSIVGEPGKGDIFVIPHTVNSLGSTIKLEPSVKALTLGNWFSELDDSGIRYLTGEITVVPPDTNAQLITRYDLYWGDEDQRRLPDTPKITGINNNGNLSYQFPSQFQVPRHAVHIIAYGRSSHGFSPNAAAVAVADTWIGGAPLTIPAGAHVTAAVNGKIYKWGGNDAGGTAIVTGECYSANAWAALPGAPSPVSKVLGIGQLGKKIVLMGQTAASFAAAQYNWETGTWETAIEEYSRSNTALAAVMVNYDFYILTANAAGLTDRMILYKTDAGGTDAWLSGDNYGANIEAPKNPVFNRAQFGVCAGNGRFFLLGGKNSTSGYLDTFTAYNPVQRKWTEMTPMPYKVRDCCCIVSGSTLYVLGGELETGTVTGNVLSYDFFLDTWEELAPMTTPGKKAAAALLNGNIYLTGGIDASGALPGTTGIYIPVVK